MLYFQLYLFILLCEPYIWSLGIMAMVMAD